MKPIPSAIALGLLALPAQAVETSMQLVIDLPGNAQRDVSTYTCEGIDEPMTVQYINAHPLFLAIVPVEGEDLVFVNVIAASGARYVSGQYQWWSRGNEAQFSDAIGEDGEAGGDPLECHTIEDIP